MPSNLGRKGIDELYAAITLNSAKNTAEPSICTGFQLPKIMTASARKPYPPTLELKPDPTAIVYAMPPMPPKNPEIRTPAYLIR